MVLEDRAIIVEEGCIRAWHNMETVGCSRVLKVVYDGRQYGRKYLQIGQPVLFNKSFGLIHKLLFWTS